MVIASIYVLLCVVGLPFWVAQQHLGGRSIILVAASALYACYAVISGTGIILDGISLTAVCLAAWICASLTWTDTKKSVFESFNWLSYLILFCAARTVPMGLIAFGAFCTGCVFAAMQMYQMCVKGKRSPVDAYFAFGNGNHTGNYMLVQLFVGLWLSSTVSPWFACFLPLIVAALATTKCKGAILGVFIGLIVATSGAGHWIVAACLTGVFSLIMTIIYLKNDDRFLASIMNRKDLCFAAIELIVKRPFQGWGLNAYAKELPETRAVLNSMAGPQGKRSHRAHNDHLEIIVELGVVGYFLTVFLFGSLRYEPVIFGLIAAFSIHACFFFPFREAHTAPVFWAVMGAAGAGVAGVPHVSIPLIVTIMTVCVAAMVMLKTFRVFLGQWYSCMAVYKKNASLEQKLSYYDIALEADPDDSGYLTDAANLLFKIDPVRAFFLVARAYVNYDGVRMKHDVSDFLARCIINAGDTRLGHWLEDDAMRLEKENKSPMEVKNFLHMRELRAGR